MSLLSDFTAAVDLLLADGEKYNAIVNGPASGAGSTVVTDSGNVKTFAKAIADFETASATLLSEFENDKDTFNNQATLALNQFATNSSNAIGTFETDAQIALDAFNASVLTSVLTALGVPSYANLTAANVALAIGQPYYDTTLNKLQLATA